MVKATKPRLDILQSCSNLASYWDKYIELESVIAVWALVFARKITHAQRVVQCIYDTAIFGNIGAHLFTLQSYSK